MDSQDFMTGMHHYYYPYFIYTWLFVMSLHLIENDEPLNLASLS